MKILETERLILRTWKQEDAEDFFAINQDLKVIEFVRGPLTMEQITDFIAQQNNNHKVQGFALWAVELKSSGELIGFIGLNIPAWQAHFTPAVEIGWRLGSQYWGKGYATEGAKAALDYGFKNCGLNEIVSFTVPANLRSRKVMERIGMIHDKSGDFAHPQLAADHPLSQHVLYRINRI
jgi:RimJ/RimL family protein N-acetyltransferase